MDPITTTPHVEYRQAELRRLAASLRWERRLVRSGWTSSVRVAVGRRLVLAGIALLDAGRPRVPVSR